MGISLAIESGIACYIPVGHIASEQNTENDKNNFKGQLSLNYVIDKLIPGEFDEECSLQISNIVESSSNSTYIVQADATVADTQVGLNFDVTLGSGSTITGISGFGMKGGAGDEAAKALRVLRRSTLPGENATDQFPKFEVKLNLHRDDYGKGSVVSITDI